MKKIIAAFDGLKFSAGTQACAIAIAKQGNAHLVGVFLDDFTYTSYKIYDLVMKEGVSEKEMRQYSEKDKLTRGIAVSDFENACKKEGIPYSIHHDRNIAFQELLHESIYADLLIIDSKETLTHYEEQMPTGFIRGLLADVQCPVLLVPEQYQPPANIVLLYDGEPSSVHAIKMFNYLFSSLKDLPTEVLSAKGFYDDLHVPDNRLMIEFMKRHSPKAVFTVLKGHAETEIVNHLKNENENTLVVLGAYRRSTVSRWFRQSMADVMMKELKLPLFIAHSK
ncbi:MAG: universal stress protein [Bacteroidota bacterium]